MQKTRFFIRFLIGVGLLIILGFLLARIRVPRLTPQPVPSPTAVVFQNIPESAPERVQLVRVVDGDTIRILRDGVEHTVRLIGINTPETVDPNTPDECYGAEAAAYLSALLPSGEIAMGSDETQQDMDRFGRLLRYLYLPDGTFVNQKMIREGFAAEYTYDRPYVFQQAFKQAQEEAQYAGLGLWSACASTPDPNLTAQ